MRASELGINGWLESIPNHNSLAIVGRPTMQITYEPSKSQIQQWTDAADAIAAEILGELKATKMFSRVGEPLLTIGKRDGIDPKRFKPIGLGEAVTRIQKGTNSELLSKSNPKLAAAYQVGSKMLYARKRQIDYLGAFESILPNVTKAFEEMATAQKQPKLGKGGPSVASHVRRVLEKVLWERLHSEALEAPFAEYEFILLQAGHLPSLYDSADWLTCSILYC
jgi:hypothetical protein